jgi:phosphopantothenate synthetase
MSTAQIIYEQYKVLPKRIREELKALIVNEDNQEQPLTLMQEIEESLKQVKLIKDGKMPKKNMRDLLNG